MNHNKTWSRNRDSLLKQYTVTSLQRPLDLLVRERVRQWVEKADLRALLLLVHRSNSGNTHGIQSIRGTQFPLLDRDDFEDKMVSFI